MSSTPMVPLHAIILQMLASPQGQTTKVMPKHVQQKHVVQKIIPRHQKRARRNVKKFRGVYERRDTHI